MQEKLAAQLEKQLRIKRDRLPDVSMLAFFVTITTLQQDLVYKAKEVFEKYHLMDLDNRDRVFQFEVYMHPGAIEQGIDSLMSALKELGDLGIEGILGPYPIPKSNIVTK